MPCASCAGLPPPMAWPTPPLPACEPKISIMPITVPSRPSKGAAEAMVASADRYFSSRCATAPRACHGGTQVGLAALGVAVEGAQAAGQHFSQGGVLRQLVHHVGGGHGLGRDRDGFIEQFRGGDTGRLEGHETFKNQRHSQYGTRNQGPDRPACGLYDGQQISLRADESNRRLWPSLQGPSRHKPLRCCARRRPICSPTKSVDNFVGNHCSRPRKVAPRRACNRLMKNCAMKKLYKSITCTCTGVLRAVFSYVAVVTAAGQILWSTCAVRAAQCSAAPPACLTFRRAMANWWKCAGAFRCTRRGAICSSLLKACSGPGRARWSGSSCA